MIFHYWLWDITIIVLQDGDSDTDSEFEDREFTVIVDDDGSDVDLDHTDLTLSRLNRIPLEVIIGQIDEQTAQLGISFIQIYRYTEDRSLLFASYSKQA